MDDRKLREADNEEKTVVKSTKEGQKKFEWATETTKKNEQTTKRREWTTETTKKTKKKPQKKNEQTTERHEWTTQRFE